jgi:hypothetical protein
VSAYIRQGATFRAADGAKVSCPDLDSGDFPPGDCTFSFGTQASYAPTTVGNGDLVAGAPVFELHLELGNSFRVVALYTVSVTLQ